MIRFIYLNICVCLVLSAVTSPPQPVATPKSTEPTFNNTRRILRGHVVGDTRPYMVYLRAAANAENNQTSMETNWMCGGVIVDERYILTSAACIEDVKRFYVISGTNKWIPTSVRDDECVNNGAKKAVWKCVPRAYLFDGAEFDNIRWMINDIAIVKVEDDFNFNRRIKGCDFIPKKIAYNNKSAELEKPGSIGSIAGWGSTNRFSDIIETKGSDRGAKNNEDLLETDVEILSKKSCKKRWHERYHQIIDQHMICGKDALDTDAMSTACDSEVNCKELVYSEELDDDNSRRARPKLIPDPAESVALKGGEKFRRTKQISGGFCENDHGGPLVVGHGKTSVVIGVISASMVRERTNQCYGPFLYTSVWNNRHLISCAINKDTEASCRRLLRSSRSNMFETTLDWDTHPSYRAGNTDIYEHNEQKASPVVFIDVTNQPIVE